MFEELIQNIAMLVTLAVALQLLAQGILRTSTRYPLTAGALFGLAAVFGMWQPFHFAPGIIYDGRSIVLSLAGAFGGPLTACVAALIASVYRLYLGGAGAPVGIAVIWEAALLGSVLYHLRRQDGRWEHPVCLLAFGVLVHSIMLALQLLLPDNTGPTIIRQIGGMVLLAYPLGFLLSALLFLQIERRQEAEQALALQTHILEMSAKGAPLPQLLEALAREIESILPSVRASILLVDDDGLHLRHGAAPGLPTAYVQAIDGVPIGEGVGSCGAAVHRRETVIVEDINTDPLWVDYRDLALAHNLRACWSTPILAEDGQPLGAFALYDHRPARPTPFHLRVVERATHLAAIAILRDRQDRALKAERDFATQVMESIGQGLNITDAEGRITYANPAYCAMTGYSAEELLGRTSMELVDEATAARLEQVLETRRRGASSTYEMTLRHKDG
ncbi:MAG: PAS domain S-box protein, partial [Caldilineae bacterium]